MKKKKTNKEKELPYTCGLEVDLALPKTSLVPQRPLSNPIVVVSLVECFPSSTTVSFPDFRNDTLPLFLTDISRSTSLRLGCSDVFNAVVFWPLEEGDEFFFFFFLLTSLSGAEEGLLS